MYPAQGRVTGVEHACLDFNRLTSGHRPLSDDFSRSIPSIATTMWLQTQAAEFKLILEPQIIPFAVDHIYRIYSINWHRWVSHLAWWRLTFLKILSI